jgi:NAD(P)-dependent dehydrogenase (short-subunit alcohol dehydrogenase family)
LNIDLTGTRILVTGASRGIGRAIARRLGLSGATVGVHFHTQEEEALRLCEELGGRAKPFQADLTDPDAASALLRDVLSALGGLEVLVNNAGIAHSAPLDLPLDRWCQAWDHTQAVNLRAPAILSLASVRHFLQTGGGRIINIASRASFRGDMPEYLAYAASKGGLVALSRSIARGFGKQNVKAFVVAPGYTRTDMAQQFFDEFGEEAPKKEIALPDLTEPEDIAPVVVLLASGLADHATGCTIDINAGSYVR